MSAADLQDVVGAEHAATLAAFVRGRRLYVPEQITPDHPIALLIGYRASRRLCEIYGGDVIEFGTGGPAGRKPSPVGEQVRAERVQGKTVQELSEAHGISIRQVYRYLSAR
jgi:hypothetical protein